MDTIGICRNPTGCNPEGNTCHFLGYACGNSSKRDDCCGAPGNSGVCKLDSLGEPRCYGLGSGCQMAGSACAYNGDCCNGMQCVPNGSGVLQCSAQCVNPSGQCSQNADCCNGLTCIFAGGGSYGTCGGGSGSGCTGPASGQACTAGGAACCPSPTPCLDTATNGTCSSSSAACICNGNIIF
jgi:hypothetical protein